MNRTHKQPTFNREDRYIVLKIKHLTHQRDDMLYEQLGAWGIKPVDCVVVESDWPEYETVWKMIEARCSPNNDTPADAITVTYGDELAAQALLEALEWEARTHEFNIIAQALARHRTTSLAAQDGLVEALEQIANSETICFASNLDKNCYHVASKALSAIKGDKS